MLEYIKNRWAESSVASKAAVIFILIVFFASFVYAAMWVLKDDYQVLFSDLNPQDASSMVEELDRNKTAYKLADNGTSILVEKDSVYKTRLNLVGKGLNLNGSVGFELFNNSEFGMTEFAQKVNYLRALQGELERTIMGFDEIKSARVHLVLPESGLFRRKNAEPKASVTVMVKHNAKLSSSQVVGIQKLISASVPQVKMQEVTVVDQTGVALTKSFVGGEDDVSVSQRLQVKKELENYMTEKLVSVLDRVVGAGKAIVTVDISVNYDEVKVTKEEIIPLSQEKGQAVGVVSRKRTTHQVDHQSAGQMALLDDATGALSKSQPSRASTNEVNYLNNRRVEQVLSSPGAINKLSVGVLVPNINDADKLAKIKEVVRMTAGINFDRGDGVVVHDINMPEIYDSVPESFDEAIVQNSPLQTKQEGSAKLVKPKIGILEQLQSESSYGLMGVFVLMVVLLYLLLRQKARVDTVAATEKRDQLLEEINAWSSNRHVAES